MIKYIFALILIFMTINTLLAQPLENQDIPKKSTLKAIFLSAALPGTGQLYTGKPTKAGIFLSADLLIIGSYFRFQLERKNAIKSYKQYANAYAGLAYDSSDDIYRLAQNYISSEEYNNSVELYARHFWLLYDEYDEYQLYLAENLIPDNAGWEWQYESQKNKYTSIRQDKQRFEIYQNFAMGAILLNRIISILDIIIFKDKADKSYELYSVPDIDGKGIRLFYEYRY